MSILELPPSRRDLPELKPEPNIDWIVKSLFSTYGNRIHPEDKSLGALLRLTKQQLDDLRRVLRSFTENLDVKAGIDRWAEEFDAHLKTSKMAA